MGNNAIDRFSPGQALVQNCAGWRRGEDSVPLTWRADGNNASVCFSTQPVQSAGAKLRWLGAEAKTVRAWRAERNNARVCFSTQPAQSAGAKLRAG